MSQQKARGFTLVELMIVVAVIGVIASLAIPNYMRFTARTRRSEMLETVSKIKLSFKTIADNTGTFWSTSTAAVDAPSAINPTNAAIPVGQADTWDTHSPDWSFFQFPPDGPVRMRYSYKITNAGELVIISVCGSIASLGSNVVPCPGMTGNYVYTEYFHTNGSTDPPVSEFPAF
jgi:prepilin-type N-terminal cleavage/methylation domain-containing protein